MPHSDMPKNAANYAALTPVSFIHRAAMTFPKKTAVIYGDLHRSWAETYARCRQMASALTQSGLKKGDVVGVIAANTPEIYEAHFGVPMAGMVLNTLNCRLDAKTISYILEHSTTRLLFVDREFSSVVKKAVAELENPPILIDIIDPLGPEGAPLGTQDYEEFIAAGDPNFAYQPPNDEWDPISVNYTSGTTGHPKGVVYHYRGAYLNALGNIVDWNMPAHPKYLWTLPMFHCNGWCFPWTVAAKAGTNICMRKVTADNIYKAIANDGADHLCGAPIVLSFMINATDDEKRPFKHLVKVMTAAAPPPAKVLQAMKEEGFDVTHAYGLTETYGPCISCAWDSDWNDLPIGKQANLKSRQGVPYVVQEDATVMDPKTMQPVPWDGETMGEVMMRGNITMKGYLKNEAATAEAFADGWFHSGDLGVVQSDGYIQLRDRAKDIIISGGENISSIEVEGVIFGHPSVAAVAVVARPDDKWGETPCAFVELKPDMTATEDEIIAYCREHLAGFKRPKSVFFRELPKTSTGKIQKVDLRNLAKTL
ncbi:MAG: acyl-CoA synthetase [Rhodobacteraceae bacterium]|nr:acyl-CoA synthetase [Paracoccaceae bacterium]